MRNENRGDVQVYRTITDEKQQNTTGKTESENLEQQCEGKKEQNHENVE
jgi:hypothetical protein